MENTPANQRILPKEFDPRSPTLDFDRTPIMINASTYDSGSSQDLSFKSVLEDSYDSFDINLSREDPSPIVSQLSLDMETSCSLSTICDGDNQNNVLIVPEEEANNNTPFLPSAVQDSPASSLLSPKPNAATAKKIIFSPSMAKNSNTLSPSVAKKSPLSPSVAKASPGFKCHVDSSNDQENVQQSLKVRSPRTPLASLNKQSDSPLNILRARQWKDFKEEREKRGIVGDSENILPPFKVAPSSVPSNRRRPLV